MVVVLAEGVEGVICFLVVIGFMSFVWEFLVRAGGGMEVGLGGSGGPGVVGVRRRSVVFVRVLEVWAGEVYSRIRSLLLRVQFRPPFLFHSPNAFPI